MNTISSPKAAMAWTVGLLLALGALAGIAARTRGGSSESPGFRKPEAALSVSPVAAFHPGAEDLARLKRGGARRDRDGVWWSRANAVTDEAGRFFVDGLPSVQMRVHAGGRTEITQPGSSVLIRTGIP